MENRNPYVPHSQPRRKAGKKSSVSLIILFVLLFVLNPVFGVILLFGCGLFFVLRLVLRGIGAANGERRAAHIPTPVRRAVNAHLCDDAREHAEADGDYAATLNDLEEGYGSYSSTLTDMKRTAAAYAYASAAAESGSTASYRSLRLSAEDLRKKAEELESLRSAGIITNEEYLYKRREYGC